MIAVSTYNLNKQQDVKTSENNEKFGIHFVKSEIALPDFSLPNLNHDEEEFSKKDFRGKKYSLIILEEKSIAPFTKTIGLLF